MTNKPELNEQQKPSRKRKALDTIVQELYSRKNVDATLQKQESIHIHTEQSNDNEPEFLQRHADIPEYVSSGPDDDITLTKLSRLRRRGQRTRKMKRKKKSLQEHPESFVKWQNH